MKDLTKSKKSKPSTMSLDEALEVLEVTETHVKTLAKKKNDLLSTSLVTKESLSNRVINRIGTSGIGALALSGMTGAYAGSVIGDETMAKGMVIAMVLSAVGTIAGILFSDHAPEKVAIVFAPKYRKTYLRESKINAQLNQLVEEELNHEELKAISQADVALKIVNRHLAKQERKVSYVSGEGFEIEADTPVQLSKWDKIRLDTIHQNSRESIGMSPQQKELK